MNSFNRTLKKKETRVLDEHNSQLIQQVNEQALHSTLKEDLNANGYEIRKSLRTNCERPVYAFEQKLDNFLAHAIERGFTVTPSEAADGGSLSNMFDGGFESTALWSDATTTYPLTITISNFGTIHYSCFLSIHFAWRRSPDNGVKIEVYTTDGTPQWNTVYDGDPGTNYYELKQWYEDNYITQIRITIKSGNASYSEIRISDIGFYAQYRPPETVGHMLYKGGDSMYGSIDMNQNAITDLPAPSADNDAARKVYSDALDGIGSGNSQTIALSLEGMDTNYWKAQIDYNGRYYNVDATDPVLAFSLPLPLRKYDGGSWHNLIITKLYIGLNAAGANDYISAIYILGHSSYSSVSPLGMSGSYNTAGDHTWDHTDINAGSYKRIVYEVYFSSTTLNNLKISYLVAEYYYA